MTPTVTLNLPFPPSTNQLHAVVGKRKILSARGRQYRANAYASILEQNQPKLGTARVHLTLTLHPPNHARRDIANYEKAAIDAIVYAGIITDDEQIDKLTIQRANTEPKGRAHITITPL